MIYKDFLIERITEKVLEDRGKIDYSASFWPLDEGYLHLGEVDMKSLREYFK